MGHPGRKAAKQIDQSGLIWGVLVLITLWHFLSVALDLAALPAPWAVVTALGDTGPQLLLHAGVSALRVVAGLTLALLVGIPVGSVLGAHHSLDRVFSPLLYLLYPVPKIAFLPVFLVLFGLGDTAKILIIFVIAVFQVIVTVRDGVRGTDRYLLESLKSMGANGWQTYVHGIFPGTLPEVFTALRLSMGTALATLFFTETFATFRGLGYFIMDAWARVAYEEMFGGIAALGVLGFVLFRGIDLMEARVCRWKGASHRSNEQLEV